MDRPFLRLLWNIFTDDELGQRIQFVLAMNQPHYAKAYDISEIMGKFEVFHFRPLKKDELIGILNARLDSSGFIAQDVFDDDTMDLILEYTNGVLRNVLTICNRLFDATPHGQKITSSFAIPILDQMYSDLIIEDRVTDMKTMPVYKDIIKLMENQENQSIESKENLTRQVGAVTGMGRSLSIKYINDLIKWGLINEERGGVRRSNRILTLNYKKKGDNNGNH